MDYLNTIEGAVLLYVQEHLRSGFLNGIMEFFSFLGNGGIFWIALCLVLLIFKKTRIIGLLGLISLLLGYLLNNLLLKNLIHRTRPYDVLPALEILVKKPVDFSFPSGHACSSFAAAGVLYRYRLRGWWVVFPIIAFMVALSRIYVGVHYPTDVLAGAFIGLLLGQLSCIVYEGIDKRKRRRS